MDCARFGRNARFTAVAVIALAIGIGINTTVFTAYKALLKRGVEARDASSIVSLTQVRQSGQQEAQFSYPDYEAYKQAHTVAGLLATGQQFEQLIMSDAGGSVDERKAASDSLFGRVGAVCRRLRLQARRNWRASPW